jgi:capsular polysaccharide biosynthesis protein
MSFTQGIYLTPQTRPGTILKPSEALARTHINGGLVYTQDKEVVKESIDNRFSKVPMDINFNIEDRSESEFLFLGYYFRHYGHFILETLPMLSYCLDSNFAHMKKLFLPYFLNANNIEFNMDSRRHPSLFNLINQFITLTGIDSKQIEFHTNYSIIKSNFIVPPKAVNGDRKKTNIQLHQTVINKIKTSLPTIEPNRNILILRKSSGNRMTEVITDKINNFAINNNIELIDMTRLSIADQISLIHETKTLIGFSGSGMHNSMFLQPGAKSINLCDFRDFKSPKCYIPNQKLCNSISGCEEYFIDFKCQDEMKKEYFIPPKDQLTTEQQNFAADNIIKNLEQILYEC